MGKVAHTREVPLKGEESEEFALNFKCFKG